MIRSNHFRVLLGASVAALLALLLTVSATQKPAQAAFPGENGKFLYLSLIHISEPTRPY